MGVPVIKSLIDNNPINKPQSEALKRLRKTIAEKKKQGLFQVVEKVKVEHKPKKKRELTYADFYKIAGASQHSEFEKYLRDILLDSVARAKFYDAMIEINNDMSVDSFKPYFELYAAERKSFQQDYTPDAVTKLLATLTRSSARDHATSKYAGYDATAGTGALIIQKWQDDRIQETPWSYAPHRYLYRADELADNVIPYLIHNFAMRGMNAIVVHGDVLTGKTKQVYFIQNSNDDFMAYSDVNVMPHSKDATEEFGVTEWLEDEIKHIESTKVVWDFNVLPMKRQVLQVNPNPKPAARQTQKNQLKLKHIAEIERAKKGKIYPEGTIIVQMSATRGQTGLLKSSGEVGSQYATIQVAEFIDPAFSFYQLKENVPRHLHRVQQGLNVLLEDIGECPFSFPLEILKLIMKEPEYEQLTLDLGEELK